MEDFRKWRPANDLWLPAAAQKPEQFNRQCERNLGITFRALIPLTCVQDAEGNEVVGAPAGHAASAPTPGLPLPCLPLWLTEYLAIPLDLEASYEQTCRDLRIAQKCDAASRPRLDSRPTNGKNALEYVLAKLPEVDPDRLYAAGHSSAAIWALLFAEHEPRIKGCIAYAPLPDLFGRAPSQRTVTESHFPGIAELSPQEHVERLTCPAFVFHAEDDHVIPIEITRRFVELLKHSNTNVTFHTVATGDHYRSMIAAGIPQGIKWLKSLPSESQAKPTLPIAEGRN